MSHGKKTFGTRERGRAAEAEGKRERERGGRRVLSGILLSSRPLRPRNEAVAGRRRTWDIILHARNSKRRWGEKEVARLIIILTWSGGGQSRELKLEAQPLKSFFSGRNLFEVQRRRATEREKPGSDYVVWEILLSLPFLRVR